MLHETEGIRVETISNVSRIREEEEMWNYGSVIL
jgi:hypothetical protein